MGECILYGNGGESCVELLRKEGCDEYIKTDKEISDFDQHANTCPYFFYDETLEWTEVHTCMNPSNETFNFNTNYGECSPFYCPFGYLPCKKDIINLDKDSYIANKDLIDNDPQQPFLDLIVIQHDLIREDLIKHLFKNYNWNDNHYIRFNRVFD